MKSVIFNQYESFENAHERFVAWCKTPAEGIMFTVDLPMFDFDFMCDSLGREKTLEALNELFEEIVNKPKRTGSDFGNLLGLHLILHGKKPDTPTKVDV